MIVIGAPDDVFVIVALPEGGTGNHLNSAYFKATNNGS